MAEWDANQRLVRSRTNGTTTQYGYDALGRRVYKETNGSRTLFFWDGDALLCETRAADEPQGPAPIREYVYYPGTFEPLALVARENNRTNTWRYHNDPNGCPTRVTSHAGEVQWAATYDAWGAVASLPVHLLDNPIRLQGQYYDDETGLH